MKKQYELISYEGQNFKYLIGSVSYCIPHIHREIELGMVLGGEVCFRVNGQRHVLKRGDLWLLNPCQSHETICEKGDSFSFVELQLSPSFFKSYFPDILRTEFEQTVVNQDRIGQENYRRLARILTDSAMIYLRREPRFELKCAALINEIFDLLLEIVPYRLLDVQEMQRAGIRQARIQRISGYIEENYDQKLLLSDLARQEGLTMPHLSHFFTENFGMSFQDYLLHLRCERAREFLLEGRSLAEVSIVCGFSAPRYLNAGFSRIYGMSPKEYQIRNRGGKTPGVLPEQPDAASVDIGLVRYTVEEGAARIADVLKSAEE